MGAAAVPTIGAVVAGFVVSKAVSAIGPKLGLSESTSNLLGMGAGIYAGGVVGGGSTTATSEMVSSTPSTVGADIPAGYGAGGGGQAPLHGTLPGGSAAGLQPSGAITSAITPPAPTDSGMLQASQTTPVDSGGTVGKVSSSSPATSHSTGTATDGGMLSQGTGATTPTTPGASGTPSTADQVIQESTSTVGRTGGGTGGGEETNWWKRLFTPEKTMDLAMAAMQGYGEAGMAKEALEYDENIAKKNQKDWESMYGGGSASMKLSYPSQNR